MSAYDENLISQRIARAVGEDLDHLPYTVAVDIAFHMTDWLKQLAEYSNFCSDPSSVTDEELRDLLMAFLTHVPNHVAAAAKLYADMPVTDVFGVGAITQGDNETGAP